MSRWNLLIILIIAPVAWTGCSMCCGPYDYEYPMMENSRYPRLDPEFGRVGSILSDPNASAGSIPKTNADLPVEELDPLEDIDGESPDDPEFDTNLDGDTDPDTGNPSVTDPFSTDGDVDTSANRQSMPGFRRLRR